MRTTALVVFLLTGWGVEGLCAGIRYRVVFLGDLPGGEGITQPSDVNNLGQVCGLSDVGNGALHSFFWHPMVGMIDIGSLIGDSGVSDAERINDLGQITGASESGADRHAEAFRWIQSEGMIGLGDLPGSLVYSWGHGINNLGHVTGMSISNSSGGFTQEAFLWTPEHGMVGLGDLPGAQFNSSANDINDSDWITGYSISYRGGEAFLWTPEDGWMSLNSPGESEGAAINNLGQIAGTAFTGTRYEAFLWTPGQGMITLGVVEEHPNSISNGFGINDRGEVVGTSHWDNPNLVLRGFIWDALNGMRALDDLVDPCTRPAPPFDHVTGARAINNRGQIVTVYTLLNPFLPGDLDGDGDVDLFDLTTLLHNFGRTGDATYTEGDIEGCDGDVDLRDLTMLLSNFGETLP